MPTLLDPIKIGSLHLKNRIVMPPMVTGLATTEGEVTEELIRHYVRRARELGLLIVEHSYVERRGTLSPGLTRLTERVHALGAPIAIQINHAGRVTTSEICGAQPWLLHLFLTLMNTKSPERYPRERLKLWVEAVETLMNVSDK